MKKFLFYFLSIGIFICLFANISQQTTVYAASCGQPGTVCIHSNPNCCQPQTGEKNGQLQNCQVNPADSFFECTEIGTPTPTPPITCQDAGADCGSISGSCCALSSNGKPLACKPTGRGSFSQCIEQDPNSTGGRGTQCANTGSACNAAINCCSLDTNTKQPLTCNSSFKCVVATAANGACIAAGKSCTFTDNCCSSGTTNATCVNGSGKPVGYSETGTCTAAANTNAGVNAVPPPPPCATPIPSNGGAANGGCSGVNSAFGFWSTDPKGFVQSLFSILLSLSGGIAVLSIIFAGYKMIMSQGDPEKIQGAKEQLTSSIIGLLFLIFSLVILEVIGVDILHLPGFVGSSGTTHGNIGGNTQNGNDLALDATACQKIASNPQCGFNGGGTGLFCGQAGSATNCGIQGNIGTLYTCDSNGNTVSFQRCPNLDCKTAIGAPNADYCGSGAILHYSCQKNGLCQQDPNGQYTTGNCNNACS